MCNNVNTFRKISLISGTLLLVGLISVLGASVLGHSGRGMFSTLLYVAPTLLLAHGWYWSSRATLRELFITALLMLLVTFFFYGYFSGSYGLSKDNLSLVALLVLPSPLGAIIHKVIKRFTC